MNLLMRHSVEQSIQDFEAEMGRYLAVSRSARSRMRRGTVIVVDHDRELYKFLDFLVTRCGLPMNVLHVEAVNCAKQVILDVGTDKVKAVIIDVGMLGDELNGSSLPAWLSKEHPRIPVWVSHCPPEKEQTIRQTMFRVGVFAENTAKLEYIHALGLPTECEHMAQAYAG